MKPQALLALLLAPLIAARTVLEVEEEASLSSLPGDDGTPTLRLGFFLPDADNCPLHFQTAEGYYGGYEVELVKALLLQTDEFQDMNVQLVRLPTFDARIEALLNGTVDLVVGALFVTPENKALVDFLVPWVYSASIGLFAPGGKVEGVNDWADLKGKTIVIHKGHFAYEELAALGAELIEVEQEEEAAAMIAAGEADAHADVDIYTMLGVNLTRVPLPHFPKHWPMGFAVQKGDPLGFKLPMYTAMQKMIEGGRNAPILQMEQQTFVAAGFDRNEHLQELVDHPSAPSLLNPKLKLIIVDDSASDESHDSHSAVYKSKINL